MLPSYVHVGSMSGHGTKPLRRQWVPDLNGTLIAVLVLAGVLALEHFHFQSRLARVSMLEVSLAKQLQDLQVSMKQQDDQLHKMNPKLDEIDTAESALKRLQEEVTKSQQGLTDIKTYLDDLATANITAQLKELSRQQGKDLAALAVQVEALQLAGSTGNDTLTLLGGRLEQLETNTSMLASKLDSHNSALKTLADQLAVHQNSTISALQQQTAAVSEALEEHRALKNRVESLKLGAVGGKGGADAAEETPQSAAAAGPANSTATTMTEDSSGGGGTTTVATPAVTNATNTVEVTSSAVAGDSSPANVTAGASIVAADASGAAGASGALVAVADASMVGLVADAAAAEGASGDDHLIRDHTALTLDDDEGASGAQAGSAGSTTGTGGVEVATNATSTATTLGGNTYTIGDEVQGATATNATHGATQAGSAADAAAQVGATQFGDGSSIGAAGNGDEGARATTTIPINSKAALDALHALVSTTSTDDGGSSGGGGTGDTSAATGADASGSGAAEDASSTGAAAGSGLKDRRHALGGLGSRTLDASRRSRDMIRFNQHFKHDPLSATGKGRFDRMQQEFDKQRQLHEAGTTQGAAATADAGAGADSTVAVTGSAEETTGAQAVEVVEESVNLVEEEEQDQVE